MVDFKTNPLVTTEWLADNLSSPDLRVVDGSYYLPNEEIDARAKYEEQHIPGAVFFDIDDISDTTSPLPHMVPPPHKFSSRVRKLGLGDGLRYVIYDQRGIFSAPRVWWTFRYFGHEDVAVLDGGLPKWLAEERPVEDGTVRTGERHFTPRVDGLLLREKDQILANIDRKREQVLDARSKERFEGTAPEPRAGLRSGHIPGSCNLPFPELLNSETQTYLKPNALRARFEASGIDLSKPIVTSCGSGVTAAILSFALYLLGARETAVYDGSWSEWGQAEETTPVETGPTAPPQ